MLEFFYLQIYLDNYFLMMLIINLNMLIYLLLTRKSNRILNYGWVEIQKSFEESSSSISLENLGITVPIVSNEHNNNSDNHRTIVHRLVNNHNININNSNNMKTDTENASQDSDDNDSNIEENSNDDHDEPVSKRSKVT